MRSSTDKDMGGVKATSAVTKKDLYEAVTSLITFPTIGGTKKQAKNISSFAWRMLQKKPNTRNNIIVTYHVGGHAVDSAYKDDKYAVDVTCTYDKGFGAVRFDLWQHVDVEL